MFLVRSKVEPTMPNLFSKATPTQTLSQATFYLTYARITTDEQLALSMCDDAEAALARLGNPPSDLRQKVINAYIDLGKLQTELGLIDNATNTNKKVDSWRGKVQDPVLSKRKSKASLVDTAPQIDPRLRRKRPVANVPPHIFTVNKRRNNVDLRLPETDERLVNTPQLACCLDLLRSSHLLQSPDNVLEPSALHWVQITKDNEEEQERLKKLAVDMIKAFRIDENKDAKTVAEIVHLAPVLDRDTFRELLKAFHLGIDQCKMLEVHLLEGLAQVIQGADIGYLEVDDMVKVFDLLSTRLRDTHPDSEYMYLLTQTLSQVLDAMADAEIKDLDREKLHKPLSDYLLELQKSHDSYIVYQAAYASQALLCIPDNETPWEEVRRRAWKVIQGVSGLVNSVKVVDIVKFIGSLEDIHEGLAGVGQKVQDAIKVYSGELSLAEDGQNFLDRLKESFKPGCKYAWYPALRGADTLIRDGDLVSFKQLVCEAPCRRELAFQWGVCQRLGEIASDSMWDDEVRKGAIDFLGEIYKNDEVWGHHVSIKKWIVNILMRLAKGSSDVPQVHISFVDKLLKRLEDDKNNAKRTFYLECRKSKAIPYPWRAGPSTPVSPSLLDRVQSRPDVKENLRQLKKQRMKERDRGNIVYIPPQAKANLQDTDDTRFPLMEKVKEFLVSDRKVFLLLGDSGAGKSTFSQELEYGLWQSYKNNTDRIPLRINLPSIDKPERDMIAKQLRKAEFTESEIRELKLHHKFIIICDGYDECQDTHNLYSSNRLNQPGEWIAQMVISCRSEYLGLDYRDRFQPGDRNQQSDPSLFQEAVIAPFSISQVHEYIKHYVSIKAPLWRIEDYNQALELIPNLKDLVKNPFLMTLSLEVLPRMMAPDQTSSSAHVTRVALYDQFVEQWLERGKKRVGEKILSAQARAAFENLTDEGFTRRGIEFLKRLAVSIYKEQGGHPIVKYSRVKSECQWKVEFFSRDNDENTLLREACPLTRTGNQFRFLHRSLLEYGLALAVFDPKEWDEGMPQESRSNRRGSVSSTFSFEEEPPVSTRTLEPDIDSPLAWRNFVSEPSIMHFLEERAQQESVFKEQLLAYIKQSKEDKKWRIAAANAITILVRAGVHFVDEDLQGIQIPGADLSYGVFDSANLQGADLRKVSLRGVWLRQADLSWAQMSGVQFGGLPFLTEDCEVLSCAYSPDGKSFAVGLSSGNTTLYSTSSWERIRSWACHTDGVRCVVYSPKGNHIVTVGQDNRVKLWDTESETCRRKLVGHLSEINSAAYSPQGHLLVSAGDDNSLRVWDAKSGECHEVLVGHTDKVTSVAYSPKDNQVASGSWDNTVRIWNVETGNCTYILNGHENGVRSTAYSPKGNLIVSGSEDKTVRLWSAQTGVCYRIFDKHCSAVYSASFSLEGDQVASGSHDGKVHLWDVETGTCRHTLSGHSNAISSVVFSPKGDRVTSGSLDGTVRLWDVSAGASRRIASGHKARVWGVSCSPRGDQVASCSSDKTIRLWDGKIGSCRQVLQGHGSVVFCLAYSARGNMIASGGADNSIRLWDTDTGKCQKVLAGHSNWVKSVAFSPDGHRLASASDDKTTRLWDVTTGQSYMTLTGHTDEVQSVVYSPNGTQIASGSKDCTVRLWDALTGVCHHTLEGHSDSVSSVAYSPRGERLASASDDTTVRLWDVETGHSLFALTGHTHKVTGIVFSPNGELLASGSEDRTVRLWNLALGTCMSPVESTQDIVQAVAWGGTPETSHLVAGCGNGSILMWQIDNEADLCRIQPYWSSTDGALTMTGASIQGVHGLSPLDKQLLEQRGAVGVPLLRDIGKLINLAVSKFRLPFYSYSTEEVSQRDRRFTI